MKKIKLHDKTFRFSIPCEEIEENIRVLAKKLNRQWKKAQRPPLFVSVLNGAFMFTAELMKEIDFPCEVAFIRLSSYQGTASTGRPVELIGLDIPVEGRDVIVLEDIVETGNTVETIQRLLREQGAQSIAFATLFFKPEAFQKPIKIDHYAMELPNDFIVGYGLDYDQMGRNLRDIYTLVIE